jgi:putative DNA primase/helicase
MMPPDDLQKAATLYVSLGLSLVEIPHGSKAPKTREWQKNTISDLAKAKAVWSTPRNIGLDHAHSGTCCLDPDDMPHTYEVFETIALSLDTYLNADTPKIKGAKGIKPVFKMPKGLTLETKKLAWPYHEDGKRKAHTVFELRGAGGQDVLPPSLHPDGIYYQWVDGYPESYDDFLELPSDLLNLWQKWDFYLPIMQSVSPYFKPPKVERKANSDTLDIIQLFNASVDLVTLLERYGYARK